MKRFIPIILALSIFLSSCGALGNIGAPAETATPTINPTEVKQTAEAMVYFMLTETAAAMPTNTLVPPTETPLPPTPTMTATLIPTVVDDTTAETDATPTAAAIPTSTPTSSSSATFACTEQQLTSWDVPDATVKVTNNVKDTSAYVFLCITTTDGQAGYISAPAGSAVQVPYGYVTATAWVSGGKTFNATTFFEVKTPDTRQLVIENGQLYYRAGCAPNC